MRSVPSMWAVMVAAWDEPGEAGGAASGAFVRVRGQPGEGSGPMAAQVEGAFHGGDEVT